MVVTSYIALLLWLKQIMVMLCILELRAVANLSTSNIFIYVQDSFEMSFCCYEKLWYCLKLGIKCDQFCANSCFETIQKFEINFIL